jgi:hypothetical protein
MGISVDAYLAYGVNVDDYEVLEQLPWSPHGPDDDQTDEWSEKRPDFATWLLKLEGIENPSERASDFKAWYEEDPAHKDQMAEYWQQVRRIEATAPVTPLHGSNEDTHLVLAVNGTVSRASWGNPIEPTLTIEDKKIQAARSFCELHNLAFEDPKWLLFSDSNYNS